MVVWSIPKRSVFFGVWWQSTQNNFNCEKIAKKAQIYNTNVYGV